MTHTTDVFRPYGLIPGSEYFLERLTSELVADGLIPEANMSLAVEWFKNEFQAFNDGQAAELAAQAGSYVLITWAHYSVEPDPQRSVLPISAENDETALALAEERISSGDVVGMLAAPSGRIIARRYTIIHKADVGDGMRMTAGSWKLFAADDAAAIEILDGKGVDWMNILCGPEGIVARR
jgi:hypothetical protein